MNAPPDISAVRFAASFTETGNSLKIRYGVDNPTPVVVALFSRVPVTQPDQSVKLPPEGSYIETNGSQLLVRKNILPPPPGMRATEQVLPYAVAVQPNSRFQEEFELMFPIPVHQPSLQAMIGREHPGMDVVPGEPGRVSGVTFELGAIAVFGATRLIPVPTDPDVFRVTPPLPQPPARRTFTASATLRQPAPVLLYRVVARKRDD